MRSVLSSARRPTGAAAPAERPPGPRPRDQGLPGVSQQSRLLGPGPTAAAWLREHHSTGRPDPEGVCDLETRDAPSAPEGSTVAAGGHQWVNLARAESARSRRASARRGPARGRAELQGRLACDMASLWSLGPSQPGSTARRAGGSHRSRPRHEGPPHVQ